MSKLFKLITVLYVLGMTTTYALSFAIGATPAFPNKYAGNQFSFELKPGESNKETLKLTNKSAETTTVQLDGVDLLLTKEGKAGYKTRDAQQTEVGTWIKFQQPTLEVPANQEINVDFTLTVPKDAKLGDYIGGVSTTYPGGTKKTDSQATIVIDSRVVIKTNVKVTDTPQSIEKAPIPPLYSPAQLYFFSSIVLFILVIGYYLIKFILSKKKTGHSAHHKTGEHHNTNHSNQHSPKK